MAHAQHYESDLNEAGLEEPLRRIRRSRVTKFALVIGGIILGLVALGAFTVLSYSETPGEASPGRIGTQAAEGL